MIKKILYTIDHHKQDIGLVQSNSDSWQPMFAIVRQYAAKAPLYRMPFKKLVVMRRITETLLVILLQYMGFMLSAFSPIEFAAGTACAFVFLRGFSVLPGIWLGTLLAFYLANAGMNIAFICASAYTLQSFFILWLSYRYINPTLIFYRRITLLKFILCSSLLTGITNLLLVFFISNDWINPLQRWLANLNGILIIACALVALDAYFPQWDQFKQLNKRNMALAFGLLFTLIFLLLYSSQPWLIIGFALSIFLLILMISKWLGWCGAIAAIFSFGMILSLGAYFQAPLFDASPMLRTLLFLQLMLTTTVIVSLVLAIR